MTPSPACPSLPRPAARQSSPGARALALALGLGLGLTLVGCDRGAGAGVEPSPGRVLRAEAPARTVDLGTRAPVRVDTLPGILSATDAVRVPGGWVLLDARARRVHVLPDEGGLPRSFGREGEGPGEMSMPRALAVSEGVVGVLEASGARLERFGLDGRVLGPVRLDGHACPFGPAQGLAAVSGGGFAILRRCAGIDANIRSHLLRVGGDGVVEILMDRPVQEGRAPLRPFAVPVLAARDGGVYVGILDRGCLDRVPTGPEVEGAPDRICGPRGSPVRLPDDHRARLEALAKGLERVGRELAMPDSLPPFTEILAAPAGPVFRVPLEDGSEALDVLERSGEVGRLLLPEHDAAFPGDGVILLARDLAEGTELSWIPWR